MSNSIAVIIHTYNEEKNIKNALFTARLLTDKVIVIDMESTDRTVEIALRNGARIYSVSHSLYVEPAREFAILKAQTDWVFLLDSDERITQDLATEIAKVIENKRFNYYKVPRKNYFLEKKWLKHGGWYPDYVIRLIKKDAFLHWPKQIHSSPVINGECGLLNEPLLHYFHPNFENMVEKTCIYEDIEANLLYGAEKKTSTLIIMRKYLGELYRRLFAKQGVRDGSLGIIESVYQAYSKAVTYLFLYEKSKKSPTV